MLQELTIYKNITFCISMLAFLAFGQTADDFFHPGSQFYIHEKIKQSKNIIEQGLSMYPDDPKLNALKEKLKEEEKKQQNQQNQSQDQQQDKQNKQDQKQREQQDKQEDQQKQQQKPEPKPQKSEKEMEKEEALRLLRQYADDDKNLNKPKKKMRAITGKKPEKDW